MKPCIITYLPPEREGRFFPASFRQNLTENPTKYPLITFSEIAAYNPTLLLKRSPELPDLVHLQFGVHNLCFLLAYCFAWKLGYTHFLYGEDDVRVKSPDVEWQWDAALFDVFFRASSAPGGLIVGGNTMLYNCFNGDRETAFRASELMAQWNTRSDDKATRNRFVAHYGSKSQADGSGSCVACNGAGAIYSVAGLKMLYPELTSPDDNAAKIELAKTMLSFDFDLGKRLWNKFKGKAFDYVAHLPQEYSAYGDVLTTIQERMDMLQSGQVCLVHSIKSPWVPTVEKPK